MKNRLVVVPMLFLCLGLTQGAIAEEMTIKAGGTIKKVLEDRKGKLITLRLAGGEELTGRVRTVTKELVQLGELSGQDYFDGVVEIGKISAVVVRVRK